MSHDEDAEAPVLAQPIVQHTVCEPVKGDANLGHLLVVRFEERIRVFDKLVHLRLVAPLPVMITFSSSNRRNAPSTNRKRNVDNSSLNLLDFTRRKSFE